MCSVGYNQIRSISEEKHVDCFKNALRRTSKSASWCCFFCFLTLTQPVNRATPPVEPCIYPNRPLWKKEEKLLRGGAKKTGLSFLSHHESCVLGIFFGLYRLALPILNFRHVYLLLILKIFYY